MRARVDDVGGGDERGGRSGMQPSAVLLDQDRDRLVALGIEMLEDRRRRGERHLVLARPAAVDDADSEFFHKGSTRGCSPWLLLEL